MMQFPRSLFDIQKLNFTEKVDPQKWTVVLNCGTDLILPDKTILKTFRSGLFKGVELSQEKLLAIEIGDQFEVSDEVIKVCRKEWTPVFEIFPYEHFRDKDFYRSAKIQLEEFTFNFWYCGEDFACGIHCGHNFFELHTQILGQGEMQKFYNKEGKVFSIVKSLLLVKLTDHFILQR